MVTAIIVAAGQGRRMQGDLRKQYLSLAGLPILTRTLMVFDRCEPVGGIIVVVPQDDIDFCRANILEPAELTKEVRLTPGGEHRQESVFNGLKNVDANCSIVVIHDGVRPFVQNEQLIACINGARESGACIMGVPAHETIKQIDRSGRIIQTLSRDDIWLAQTPQAFKYDAILKAHERAQAEGFSATDDAILMERAGAAVKIIKGSRANMKITVKEDLELARRLLEGEGLGVGVLNV
jgi:2-C-methyl-D-erythritol 4-phosphate cytidylyltransferase